MSNLLLPAILEKNKTSSGSAILLLLEVQFATPLYLVNNNENIVWNEQEWLAFPFTIGNLTDDGKETMSVDVKVTNITRELGVLVESVKGAGGTLVILRAINYSLINDTPSIYLEFEENFEIKKASVDAYWVTFTIGVPRDLIVRFPMRTVLRNFCPYRFKDIECAYAGAVTTCNKTLADCRARGNSRRFGGEPGLTGNLG
jgi:phage-related protein